MNHNQLIRNMTGSYRKARLNSSACGHFRGAKERRPPLTFRNGGGDVKKYAKGSFMNT
jgi:hypothetical protein